MTGFIELTNKRGLKVLLSIALLGIWEQADGSAVIGSLNDDDELQVRESYESIKLSVLEAKS